MMFFTAWGCFLYSSGMTIKHDTTQIYSPYWEIGTLDPVRDRKWPGLGPNEHKLEHVPIEPTYIAYISEGDRHISGAYHNIELRYESDGTILIKPFGHNHSVILFIDFGRVLPGTFEFEADPPASVEISFETGEALLPKQKYLVNTDPDGTRKKFGSHIEHAGWAGMHYAWIYFKNITKPFTVYSLNGIYQIRPSNYIGSFECNDEMLERIWEMCAYSAHAVMGGSLLETIPRLSLFYKRCVWTGLTASPGRAIPG